MRDSGIKLMKEVLVMN